MIETTEKPGGAGHADPSGPTSLQVALDRLLARTVAELDRCDTASVTLWLGAEMRTGASFDGRAAALDEAQFEEDSGPTLSTIRSADACLLERIVAGSGRYEGFRGEAARLGVRSALSVPVVPATGRRAALNCYSRSDAAFGEPEIEAAQRLAALAAAMISDERLATANADAPPAAD